MSASSPSVTAEIHGPPLSLCSRRSAPQAHCDYWLALEQRDGHPVNIQAEINDTEETYEAVTSGIGICLLAAGNAPIFARGDVTMIPVRDLSPSELVLAWNERHCPPLLETFVALCAQVSTGDDALSRRGAPVQRVSAGSSRR